MIGADDSRLQLPSKAGQEAVNMDYLPVVVSLISGGLAGALVNAFITDRRQRTQIALSVLERFFTSYEDIADAKRILQAPQLMALPDNQNVVRKVGDWFELVASLWKRGSLDRGLMREVAIPKEMDLFRDLVTGSKSTTSAFAEAKNWWPDLYEIELGAFQMSCGKRLSLVE
jgi:hypothetical protein